MSAGTENARIWDTVYADGGSNLWYPSEPLVGLVRSHEKREGLKGIVLDHGCGSGNTAEFLVRSGHRVVCGDVSPAALGVLRGRFAGAKLRPVPNVYRIDPERPLAGQLPAYDHVIAWSSLHYNPLEKARSDFSDLIAGIPSGGAFFAAVSSPDDDLATRSERLPDGSRRLIDDVSGQSGVTVAIPHDFEEFESWCAGIEVRERIRFGVTHTAHRLDYYGLYGIKK